MKKIFKLLMLVVVATGTVACSHDTTEDFGVNVGDKSQLTLSLDGVRTQLGAEADGHYPLTWGENDQISVNGSISEPLTIEDGAGKSSAIFTFDETLQTPYFIAYPAVEVANRVIFAAIQHHSSNTSFEDGVATMYAYSEDGKNITLEHLTGILKFGIVGEATLANVRISTVERKPIAGSFNAVYNTKKKSLELTPAEDVSEIITYSFGDNNGKLHSTEPTFVHIAVPAGVYGELYVTLEDAAGGVMYKTVITDSSKPIKAGEVRAISDIISYEATTKEYAIANYDDLCSYKEAVEGGDTRSAILINDIEVEGDWSPINAPAYTGTINGNGFAIKNLNAPLFDTAAASFRGLHLVVNVEERVNPNFGAFARKLAPVADASVFERCSVSGTIKIDTNVAPATEDTYADGAIGGFVGIATNVVLEECINNATIELVQYSTTTNMQGAIGGFVGLSEGGVSFTNCTNNGDLICSDATCKTNLNIGGIIAVCFGMEATVSFADCINNGTLRVSSTAETRDCNMGGIGGCLDDIGEKSNFIYVENKTTNNGAILIEGKVSLTARVGGIIGYGYRFRVLAFGTVTKEGEIKNNGPITISGEVGSIYAGGVLGHKDIGTFNMNCFVTNSKTATISVSALTTENCFIGGVIGTLTSSAVITRIQYKTVTNKAAITYSGTCGASCCIGGFVGYINGSYIYINYNGKFANEGKIEVAEDAVLNANLQIGGINGCLDGSGRLRSGDSNLGQVVNKGDIYFKGKAVNGRVIIGGVYGEYIASTTNSDATKCYLINVGNIYAVGEFSAEQVVRVGGILGNNSIDETKRNLHNARCYCDIHAYYIAEDGTVSPYPQVGMITGMPKEMMGTIVEAKLGGKIATSVISNGDADYHRITVSDYYDYVCGTRKGLIEFSGAGYLSSKDAIDYGDFGNN